MSTVMLSHCFSVITVTDGCACVSLVVGCVAYPCSFVSCEQRGVQHSLSNLCLCRRSSALSAADCVFDVIPPQQPQQPLQQHQQQLKATCADCLQLSLTPPCQCRASNDRRRRRRSAVAAAACSGRCGRHAASPTTKCRNGGTPTGLDASSAPRCQCRAGFFGDRCQLLDPCSQQPCRNGGYCRSLLDLTGAPSSHSTYYFYSTHCNGKFIQRRRINARAQAIFFLRSPAACINVDCNTAEVEINSNDCGQNLSVSCGPFCPVHVLCFFISHLFFCEINMNAT